MKKLVKKFVHKPEAERSKVEKLVRDVAFFFLVGCVAVMTYCVIDAHANQTEAEAKLISAQIEAQQVAFHR